MRKKTATYSNVLQIRLLSVQLGSVGTLYLIHTFVLDMATPQVQEYWLPGYGLSRNIVLSNIQYFLGPSATVRPYTYQGREGYLIVGVPLTRVSCTEAWLLCLTNASAATNRRSPEIVEGVRKASCASHEQSVIGQ